MTETDKGERNRLAEAHRVAEHLVLVLDRAGRAMDALLDGTGTSTWRSTWLGAPSEPEEAAEWAARALDNTAARLLELHATPDGPGPRRFAEAAKAYAAALRVAADGRWPPDLDRITAAMREALAEARADARLVARGAIRGHEWFVRELCGAGLASLAEKIEKETRHELASLDESAGPAAPNTDRIRHGW